MCQRLRHGGTHCNLRTCEAEAGGLLSCPEQCGLNCSFCLKEGEKRGRGRRMSNAESREDGWKQNNSSQKIAQGYIIQQDFETLMKSSGASNLMETRLSKWKGHQNLCRWN